jgi:hypothetical protein
MKRQDRKTELRRCAIYTRVSTEYGLEQEFNSLDNQREASEGLVTLSNEERDKFAAREFSGGCDGRTPRVHRRSATASARSG